MAASSRGSRAVASIVSRRSPAGICYSCRMSQFRPYSAAAAVATSTATAPATHPAAIAEAYSKKPTQSDPQPPITKSGRQEYTIKSSMILTRAPLITRDLTPFETSFYFYQKRLNERLVLPFRHTLFFKKDTAQDLDWRIKFAERGELPAKELGRYRSQGRNAWNDELLVGSTLDKEERIREILLKDAETRVTEDGDKAAPEDIIPVEPPAPRESEADVQKDRHRLDRKLKETLYLIVKDSQGQWQFPTAAVPTDEHLHQTASRVLEESAGVNMNTWMVGRAPVAHHVVWPKFDEGSKLVQRGEKTFFLRGRIFAGQADLAGNKLGLTDFQWLTKDELQKVFQPALFKSIRNMMADR